MSLHSLIDDNKEDLAKKIKLAAENELEYWENRKRPPNLSKQQFQVFIEHLKEGDITSFSLDQRESGDGKYGKTGLDWVFKFELELEILGVTKRYFCKGFFFEKTDLRGVEIQTFREVKLTLV